MTDNDYDIFLTLKFTSHYGSKLGKDENYRQQFYRRYWKKVNEIIYGKRNTAYKGLKTEQVQHFGEFDSNAHLHARVKCPSFMDIEELCILLNTVWKAKFYTEASSPKYNHITPIINNDRVIEYMTRQQHRVDVILSTQQANYEIIDITKARHLKAKQRINHYINTPHINLIYKQAVKYYPLHVLHSKIHYS